MTFPAQQNLATGSKWIAEIPFSSIFTDVKLNVNLNITKCTMPGMNSLPTETSYQAYKVSVPSRVQAMESRDLVLEYILSSDYNQYILLQRWINASVTNKFINGVKLNEVDDAFEESVKIPISLILLSEFKKEVLRVKYHNCFITKIDPLALKYDINEEEILKHQFTCTFTHYTIEKVN